MNANGSGEFSCIYLEITGSIQLYISRSDSYKLGILVRYAFSMESYAVKMEVSCLNNDNSEACRTIQTKGMVPSLMYILQFH